MSHTTENLERNTIKREAVHKEESDLKTVKETISENYGNTTRDVTKPKIRYLNFDRIDSKTYAGKRFLDLTVSLFASLAFVILFPIIALGIKLNSRGPVLFKQRRTGQNGIEFFCYKFRTMHFYDVRRYDGKPVVTQKNDNRIFWFGKLLRKTNLDELPQIINVFKGDMSLIGPRPYPVQECAYWNNTFDDFFYRYKVKPGVSGLAQVNGFRGGTLDVELMRKRLDYDLIYVQKQSFWLDVKILFRTFSKLVNMNKDAH